MIFLLFHLLFQTTVCFNSTVSFNIDASVLTKLDDLQFGNNILAYNGGSYVSTREIYTEWGYGIWNATTMSPEEELFNEMKKLNLKSIRYPGGCGTHGFDWKITVGSDREHFAFGLEEFLGYCEEVGAFPIITMSYFTGTQDDLVDMLHFIHSDKSTGNEWANKRIRDEPYRDAIYFEYGNEIYHGNHGNISSVGPREYGENFNSLFKKVRDFDDSLKLGMVLQISVDSWNSVLFDIVEDFDFGIIHPYTVGYSKEEHIPDLSFQDTFAGAEQRVELLEGIYETIKDIYGKEIPFGLTEFNGHFVQSSPVPYRHTLGNGVINALLFGNLLSMREKVLTMQYWDYVNEYWGIMYKKSFLKETDISYVKRPNYFVYLLYSEHFFGNYWIPLDINSECFPNNGFGSVEARVCFNESIAINTTLFQAKDHTVYSVENVTVEIFDNTNISTTFDHLSSTFNYYHTGLIIDVDGKKDITVYATLSSDDIVGNLCIEMQDIRGYTVTGFAKKIGCISEIGTIEVKQTITPLSDATGLKLLVRVYSGGLSGNILISNVGFRETKPKEATKYVSAFAAYNNETEKMSLMLINKRVFDTEEVQINIIPKSSTVRVREMVGEFVNSTNENYVIGVELVEQEIEIENREKGYFTHQLDKHSVTVIEFDYKIEFPDDDEDDDESAGSNVSMAFIVFLACFLFVFN